MQIIRLGLATVLLGVLAGSADAQSFGRWHIPSTFPQYLGCGNGAGHHAPIARAPGARPLYVRRVATLPPSAWVPNHCKHPHQNCFYSGCATGSCSGSAHFAPQMGQGVYHQPTQPTMAPSVHSTFAAPPSQPMKSEARSIVEPAEQLPPGKSQEGSSLRSPPMPKADPVSDSNDSQASYGF